MCGKEDPPEEGVDSSKEHPQATRNGAELFQEPCRGAWRAGLCWLTPYLVCHSL